VISFDRPASNQVLAADRLDFGLVGKSCFDGFLIFVDWRNLATQLPHIVNPRESLLDVRYNIIQNDGSSTAIIT
jgi:hypothetical protein